jgi:hypothetical protein
LSEQWRARSRRAANVLRIDEETRRPALDPRPCVFLESRMTSSLCL